MTWVRIVNNPYRHRWTPSLDDVSTTECGVRFIYARWPKTLPRPPLPNCPECLS